MLVANRRQFAPQTQPAFGANPGKAAKYGAVAAFVATDIALLGGAGYAAFSAAVGKINSTTTLATMSGGKLAGIFSLAVPAVDGPVATVFAAKVAGLTTACWQGARTAGRFMFHDNFSIGATRKGMANYDKLNIWRPPVILLSKGANKITEGISKLRGKS